VERAAQAPRVGDSVINPLTMAGAYEQVAAVEDVEVVSLQPFAVVLANCNCVVPAVYECSCVLSCGQGLLQLFALIEDHYLFALVTTYTCIVRTTPISEYRMDGT
jgi:hypothetical protein